MITDASIREQGYTYFLSEAPELLQIIDQELFDLKSNYSIGKIHNLMRATHTLKGGAASVGLDNIKTIAHSLEDIFKALYNPSVVIDNELQLWLLEAYKCLQLSVTAELTKSKINRDELLQRATLVFANLQEKLGDAIGCETHIPTAEELGFDIVGSIFEVGVQQRLDGIAKIIQQSPSQAELIEYLSGQLEVFLGLADSLNLPAWGDLTRTISLALEAHPEQALTIANLALADLRQSQKAILAGDRTSGGFISPHLKQLAQTANSSNLLATIPEQELAITTTTASFAGTFFHNTTDFYRFLTISGNRNNQPLKPANAKFYLKVIRYIFGWFNHHVDVPVDQLNLSLLIPADTENQIINYVEEWLSNLLNFLESPADSPSLCLYRRGVILIIILAVAKFQYSLCNNNHAIGIIRRLRDKIRQVGQDYKNYPPVTEQERNWLESHKLQELLTIKPVISPLFEESDNSLLESIWGDETLKNQPDQSFTPQTVGELPDDDYLGSVTSSVVSEQVLTAIHTPMTEILHEPVGEDKTINASQHNLRQPSFVRVNVEGLQHLNYLAGELLIYQKRRTLLDEQVIELIEQLSQRLNRHQSTLNELRDLPLQGNHLTFEQKHKVSTIAFDTLEMDIYTEFNLKLHEAMEEALQLQETNESLELLSKQASEISEKQSGLTLNIIDNLVEARMLPLGTILNRFPQMVYKLGSVYAKSVDLKLSGGHVLVDKAIAERLYDPLLQLVRNAFDHGIELPRIRRQQGKPETGTIEICAYHQGSQTIIEVRDDGCGLNLDNIRQRAIDLHIIADDAANSYGNFPSAEELIELMFSPGFSTVGQVSEMSGRGMGLDIVKTQIQALNGSISVQSSPNQGTTFILKIPFSMTTDKLMLVQAGGFVYALLIDSIEKIIIPTTEQVQAFEGKQVIHLGTDDQEEIVSILKLSSLIDYSSSLIHQANLSQFNHISPEEKTRNPILLIRRSQGVLLGLEVDLIMGEQELVIRPLGSAIYPPKYIYGCSNLANGNLVLVIDATLLTDAHQMQAKLDVLSPNKSAVALIENRENSPREIAVRPKPLLSGSNTNQPISEIPKLSKQILIVDDAISLRQMLALTLQKFGYQVIQAQNGIEAIEQLKLHPDIEVVISDLEMPKMNGFELLSHIRQNSVIHHKPVVVLTSRSADKHRHLAQELGANAYLTKPFLEHELISTLDKLTPIG